MTVSATRSITIQYTGDVNGQEAYEAAVNTTSPGVVQVYKLLSSAANGTTLTLPDYGISTLDARCVTIIKPAGYAGVITLKGTSLVANADGIKLHPTDPDCLTFAATVDTFVIHVTVDVELRFVWT